MLYSIHSHIIEVAHETETIFLSFGQREFPTHAGDTERGTMLHTKLFQDLDLKKSSPDDS